MSYNSITEPKYPLWWSPNWRSLTRVCGVSLD